MRGGWLLAAAFLPLAGCLHAEPEERVVWRPIHQIETAPDKFEERVSVALYADEAVAYVRKMQAEGWGVLAQFSAAEAGTIVDDPVKPKLIVIFQRYNTKQ